VSKVPQPQIYHPIDGDFFVFFQNLFILNFLEINSLKGNKGGIGFSIILTPIFMSFIIFHMQNIG
jgi:hypothetical protein